MSSRPSVGSPGSLTALPSNRAAVQSGAAPLIVGIVAAYPSLRAGLATLIQNDRRLTASAIAPQSLSTSVRTSAIPNIAQLDVILVEPSELAPDILANLARLGRTESVPVLWLGSIPVSDDGPDTGAGGLIPLDADADTLIAAIRAVAQGLRVVDPDIARQSADGPQSLEGFGGATDSTLSPREREVLELVASGLPNKAIARSLGISDHTVKFHVSSVLTKLDAGSRTEAVTIASRRGILAL